MERPYLILVNGVLAKRRITLAGALKVKKELESRGFKGVSVAETLTIGLK